MQRKGIPRNGGKGQTETVGAHFDRKKNEINSEKGRGFITKKNI